MGGDISRVKRESAGDGRKRKSVGRLARAQASNEEGSDNACEYVRAACGFGRARAHSGEAARNVKRLRGAKFNCEPLPAPVLLLVALVRRALSVVVVVTLADATEYVMRYCTRTRDRDGYGTWWYGRSVIVECPSHRPA